MMYLFWLSFHCSLSSALHFTFMTNAEVVAMNDDDSLCEDGGCWIVALIVLLIAAVVIGAMLS